MMNDDYLPVSCEQHSEYELAVMHGQVLHITWQDRHGQIQSMPLKPCDLFSEQKSEYLSARGLHGEDKKIRLDKIIRAQPITNQ